MVEFKISGLDGTLANLRALPKEIVGKRGGPVLKSLKKGARVIQKPAIQNAKAVTSNATKSGERVSTGLLAKSIIVTRGKEPTGGKGERVLIRIPKRVYVRKGEPTLVRSAAAWTEYGTENRPAEPFLRPAFIQYARQAIDATTADLLRQIDEIQKRLGA